MNSAYTCNQSKLAALYWTATSACIVYHPDADRLLFSLLIEVRRHFVFLTLMPIQVKCIQILSTTLVQCALVTLTPYWSRLQTDTTAAAWPCCQKATILCRRLKGNAYLKQQKQRHVMAAARKLKLFSDNWVAQPETVSKQAHKLKTNHAVKELIR